MTAATHPIVVRVRGCSGGLGSSTVAAGLARALAPSRPVVLVDLDLEGGGLDVTCGVEHLDGLRWSDLCDVRGAVDPVRLADALPGPAECKVLSAGPARLGSRAGSGRPSRQVVGDVVDSLVGSERLVVTDHPRGIVDIPVVATVDVLVVGTRTRHLADLDGVLHAEEQAARDPRSLRDGRLVVVTVGSRDREPLSDAIRDHTGLPVIGHVPWMRSTERALERGEWPSGRALDRLASQLVRRLPELRVAA